MHSGSGDDLSISPGRAITCPDSYYTFDSQVSLMANSAFGWHVAGWSGTDNDSSTATSNSVTMPDRDHSVSVIYAPGAVTRAIFLPMISRSAPSSPPSFPQLANGGFDSLVDTSWRQSSTRGESLIYAETEVAGALGQPFIAHSRPNLAWLGGILNEQATLQQSVRLPDEYPDVRLSFWYWIGSSEKNCGADRAYVEVGATQLAAFDLCQVNNTGGWQRVEIGLAGLVGSTVDVTFRSTQDGVEVSNWFLDDVVLCDGTSTHPCE